MDRYIENNRLLWNGFTRIHMDSKFYDVAGFRAGKSSLNEIELEAMGDVRGLSLLHLQCHFGLDTLSWAREGARVTGVDLSDEAIDAARALSDDVSVPARFICSDVYAAAELLDEPFDRVFTSYGVTCWLPDLARWAELIVGALKPGGVFYMVEFHPFLRMLDEKGEDFEFPYFQTAEPVLTREHGSYANSEADFSHDCYEWMHSIGEVVSALVRAGLRIDRLDEYAYSPYDAFTNMQEVAPGRFAWRGAVDHYPHLFSVTATRD